VAEDTETAGLEGRGVLAASVWEHLAGETACPTSECEAVRQSLVAGKSLQKAKISGISSTDKQKVLCYPCESVSIRGQICLGDVSSDRANFLSACPAGFSRPQGRLAP